MSKSCRGDHWSPVCVDFQPFSRAADDRPYNSVYLKLTAKLQFIAIFAQIFNTY